MRTLKGKRLATRLSRVGYMKISKRFLKGRRDMLKMQLLAREALGMEPVIETLALALGPPPRLAFRLSFRRRSGNSFRLDANLLYHKEIIKAVFC